MRIDKNIDTAETPPSSFYTSEEIFEKSKSIFENSYQFVCHQSELIKTNNIPFILFKDWLDIPLVITKEDDHIFCLSNVCTHRGNIVCNKKEHKNKLVCNYHGRTFNLDGSVNHAPGFKETKNFPTKDDSLNKNINLVNWNGLLFVNTEQNKSINLMQLAGLINRSSYVIANDTGPAHMAAHLGKKGIVIFGHHTTPEKVSIETDKYKAITIDRLENLSADKIYKMVKEEIKLIN